MLHSSNSRTGQYPSSSRRAADFACKMTGPLSTVILNSEAHIFREAEFKRRNQSAGARERNITELLRSRT